jgi:pyridoxamine 5'-phosphate oxidase
MLRDLRDQRKSYEQDTLLDDRIEKDPFKLFDNWYSQAERNDDIEEANAMALSTLGTDGFPKARIVLLKELLDNEFILYTNYGSEKAVSIAHHDKVSLNFFWPALEKQVIIKAVASKVSTEKSESYFSSRPRGSQIGAWTSDQSREIESRDALERKKEETELRFRESEIPLPPDWGGISCKPVSMEFWQGRQNRLHDRILYTRDYSGKWTHKRLQP